MPMSYACATILLIGAATPAAAGARRVGASLPDPGCPAGEPAGAPGAALEGPSEGTAKGWPVDLGSPGAGFPYTPTLFDIDGDGDDEIFLMGGEVFGLDGDGSFLPGWPTSDMQYMGYASTGQLPGPSCADMEADGDVETLWSERDWYAGSSHMWSFNGREPGGGWMPGFPQEAPDEGSNALATPFVLGDADGDGDLEAWTAHTLGNTGEYYRISGFDHQGNRLFTTDLDPAELILNVYFGDLEGDGTEEFFAVGLLADSYRLHAFTPEGNHRSGYPLELFDQGSGYAAFGPPVPADLDGDGDLEVVVGYTLSSTATAEARHHDGSPVEGFPISITGGSQLFYIGLGDITGDGDPELLAFENELAADYRAWAVDMATGETLAGWPVALSDWPKGFPTVVDVTDDGLQEVCCTTDGGELWALQSDGSVAEGFPKAMSTTATSGAAAGDIDGDGLYELVACTWDGHAYAWDTEGAVAADRADWPMRGVDARNTGVYAASGGTGLQPETPGGRLAPAANPSAGSVELLLPAWESAVLEVYDMTGRRVCRMDASGRSSLVWAPSGDRPSGVYVARLRSGGRSLRAGFVLLR